MKKGNIALITGAKELQSAFQQSLSDQFEIDIYKSPISFNENIQGPNKKYEIIISDAEPNDPGGINFRRSLLNHPNFKDSPYILLVDKLTSETRTVCLKEKIDDVFQKPLDFDRIKFRLENEIEQAKKKSEKPVEVLHYKLPLSKRIFDLMFSGFALLMLSPLFLIVAILIRLESKGKVFYYSTRVGTNSRYFRFWKFRSMYSDADQRLKEFQHLNQYAKKPDQSEEPEYLMKMCDECIRKNIPCQKPKIMDWEGEKREVCEKMYNQRDRGSAFVKLKDDPRVTKVGKFIRNTSIDELPQLWNVLIGDMSIVGNRPLPKYEFELISKDTGSEIERIVAPAGITGLWQVEKRGKGEMSEEERLQLDIKYARRARKPHLLLYDIKLILRTIPALFQKENV